MLTPEEIREIVKFHAEEPFNGWCFTPKELEFFVAKVEQSAIRESQLIMEGQREVITDLEDRLEKAQAALEKIAFMGMDAGMMNSDLEYFYKSQLSNCIGIAARALQSIPADTKGGE